MKTNKFSVPLAMATAVAGLAVMAASCAKKSAPPEKNPAPPPESQPTNTVADVATNAPAATNALPAEVLVETNVPPVSQEITNPPPAETTTKAPEPISLVDTNLPGHTEVVAMPTNLPVAPTNFYPVAAASGSTGTNQAKMTSVSAVTGPNSTNFFLRFQAGYQHVNHGDNHDTYAVGAKFYAYGDGLRGEAGKFGWLIPDATAEISSQYLPKSDGDRSPGSDNGLQFRAGLTWPWLHWTSLLANRPDSVCPFCQPLKFSLGPTVNAGFDHLYNESDYRFARYGGLRLAFNRSGFIEYTVGATDGLDGTRQQLVAEIPFYESRDGEVRYYLRGLWNRGDGSHPDVLTGGLFLEMPFTTLIKPEKWRDLVPFLAP